MGFTDLSKKNFGNLTVDRPTERRAKNRSIIWECRCVCGNITFIDTSSLKSGNTKSCGCGMKSKVHRRQKINHLTALYPTDNRDSKGHVIWHCRCDCGNEINISYNELLYSNRISCGCRLKKHQKNLQRTLTRAGGTSIDRINSKNIQKNNTTGYTGVYYTRGKYYSKIYFQNKSYSLGTYERIEDAVAARREAEEILFEPTAAFYIKWKQKAHENPAWAAENPIKISVHRTDTKGFELLFEPEI